MRLLITAGPTREFLDPVRFLSNASSGRLGCALASAAKAAGHEVALVLGPCPTEPPDVDELLRVTSAQEMFEAVAERFESCDVFIAAAAACDYRPVRRQNTKIKKASDRLIVEFDRTQDILDEMSERRTTQILVGFCLETEDLERRARSKLAAKGLDLIVANGPKAIAADRQDALLISRDGRYERLSEVTKEDLATRILAAAETLAG